MNETSIMKQELNYSGLIFDDKLIFDNIFTLLKVSK